MAVTIGLTGDVMFGRSFDPLLSIRPPEDFWGTAHPILRSADALLANLACAITARTRPRAGGSASRSFRAHSSAVAVLGAAGVNCVGLASDHVLDFGPQGLLDTMRHLDEAEIAHAGAGHDDEEAWAPAAVQVKDVRMAVLAACVHSTAAAGRGRSGVASARNDAGLLSRIEAAVRRARADGAQLVILSLSSGPDLRQRPGDPLRTLARGAVDRGVDVVCGHGSHLFQGIELHGRGLILYDTGDILCDYTVDPVLRNDRSLIFLLDWEGRRPVRLRMVPVRLSPRRVELADAEDAAEIVSRMEGLCAEFGTPVARSAGGLVLLAPPTEATSVETGQPATVHPPVASEWNLVVSGVGRDWPNLCQLLARFGHVRPTAFEGTFAMHVDDPGILLDAVHEWALSAPGGLSSETRLALLARRFSFGSAAAFRERLLEAGLAWLPQLAGKRFHARIHQRGDLFSATEEERHLEEALLQALEAVGAPGVLSFETPEVVLLAEVLGNEAGVSLWTHGQLLRYPFIERAEHATLT